MEVVRQYPADYTCPIDAVTAIVGGKYKLIILYSLLHKGTLRFSELSRLIPQATQKMLTQQLRDLETDGIITRKVYPVIPPKTEYSLTDQGTSLGPIIESMCAWGANYIRENGGTLQQEQAQA